MRNCLLIFATCSVGVVAWAQSTPLAPLESANSIGREQRRTELRIILQAHRQWEPTATAANPATPVERHLTEQERAQIREQLRQLRSDRPKSSP